MHQLSTVDTRIIGTECNPRFLQDHITMMVNITKRCGANSIVTGLLQSRVSYQVGTNLSVGLMYLLFTMCIAFGRPNEGGNITVTESKLPTSWPLQQQHSHLKQRPRHLDDISTLLLLLLAVERSTSHHHLYALLLSLGLLVCHSTGLTFGVFDSVN